MHGQLLSLSIFGFKLDFVDEPNLIFISYISFIFHWRFKFHEKRTETLYRRIFLTTISNKWHQSNWSRAHSREKYSIIVWLRSIVCTILLLEWIIMVINVLSNVKIASLACNIFICSEGSAMSFGLFGRHTSFQQKQTQFFYISIQ